MGAPESSDPCAVWVSAIEECFVAIRGRGVVWAPEDAARAARWYRAGVSLGVAVRVLLARVRAWQFRHGDDARLPMHLGYYEPAILQACRLAPPARVATVLADQAPANDEAQAAQGELPTVWRVDARLAELLDDLPSLIAQTDSLILHFVYRKAFEILDAAQRPPAAFAPDADLSVQDLSDPLAVIDKCRTTLRKTALQGLDEGQAEALQAWAAARQRRGLSKKAMQARLVALQEAWLGAHLGLRVPTLDGWWLPELPGDGS